MSTACIGHQLSGDKRPTDAMLVAAPTGGVGMIILRGLLTVTGLSLPVTVECAWTLAESTTAWSAAAQEAQRRRRLGGAGRRRLPRRTLLKE
jgi:hypothetical protein